MEHKNNVLGHTPLYRPFISRVCRDRFPSPISILLHMKGLHPHVNIRNEELIMAAEELVDDVGVEAPTQPPAAFRGGIYAEWSPGAQQLAPELAPEQPMVKPKRTVEETVVEETRPPSSIGLPPPHAQNEEQSSVPHMFDLNKLPDEQD